MSRDREPSRQVFLSHTSELEQYPPRRSFVEAAEEAIIRAGDMVTSLVFSPSAALPPAQVCRRAVAAADLFVLIAGFRYGRRVPDRLDLSYTELAFNAATKAGIPRLVFLLSEKTEGPTTLFVDTEYGASQEAFRRRLMESATVKAVTSPDGLEAALLDALTALPRPEVVRGHDELVFLCHSSGDKIAVRLLYHRLTSDGVRCWFDEGDLLPGQDWDHEISEAIRRSRYVLACLSTASITKTGYVQKELKRALDFADEQPEGSIFLIPARLEDCEVPTRLAHLHWVDLFRQEGYERLLKALRFR